MESKINDAQFEIQKLLGDKESLIFKIDQIQEQRGILIEEKKNLHSDMDFYKDNYPEELRAFYLEDKYKNEILSI